MMNDERGKVKGMFGKLRKKTETTEVLRKFLFVSVISAFFCNMATAQDSVERVEVPNGPVLDMVYVEGGMFTMGSEESKGVANHYEATRPEHEVEVGAFYMGRYEVTQELWSAVMGENGSTFRGSGQLPVESITWTQAQEFCMLLSQMTGRRFRLPTEAEWEFAARAGKDYAFAGCERNGLDSCAWYCVNSEGRTHAVGSLKPNALGLYDMSGNVAEWCGDWMGDYTEARQSNPRGPQTGDSRIVRGGHYYSTSSSCAVFDRGWFVPTAKTEYYGLRLVMEIDK